MINTTRAPEKFLRAELMHRFGHVRWRLRLAYIDATVSFTAGRRDG